MLSEQAANYSVIGNCILGMSRYAIRRRRFLIFLYTHPSVLHMRTILITLFPGGSPSNPHTIFYGKDIVKPKCHRNVRATHPISLKTAWIVTKLGHFKIFSQYPCVTAAALWYPQWTIARFFWLAAGLPTPQSQNIAWRSAAGRLSFLWTIENTQ